MFNKKKFAEILSKINNTYDTMTEFSEKSGVNRTYLSQYINQKLDSPPSPKVLMKIANHSNNVTNYEELMNVCGFLINNGRLDELREAQENLKFENLMKGITLNNKETNILNKLITSYETFYVDNESIEESEQKALSLLISENLSNCNIDKIKNGFQKYILSKCSETVVDLVYERQSELDSKYNLIEALEKVNALSNEIGIKNSKSFYMCPVYGQISAGQPNWAEENIEGRLPIDTELMGIINPEEYFFLRVNGESMNNVIKNGAFALIHKQDIVEDGEIAVVLVNGYDATLKKFTKKGDVVVLEPDSTDSSFKTQIYDKTTPIKILGKYVRKMEINR